MDSFVLIALLAPESLDAAGYLNQKPVLISLTETASVFLIQIQTENASFT